ncbi:MULTISPECIES: alpha/beta hydrolase [Emticicia]|uniref:alpha/beta hydrolase n=1 Tax=Emticicia TaxID=312278 RepID=UPI0007D89B4F|nr:MULTISPECIES: alpha/beta hydrolase [Emticicia]
MNTTELSWKSSDGLNIYGKKWESTLPTKAVICIMHGMGEHINRYNHVAEMFTSNGYSVIGCDHRGHGKSEGKSGHFPDFDTFLNDVDTLLKVASEHFPNTKQILYGHSMGGNLVANYLLRRQPKITGAILSSPYFQLAFQPSKITLFIGRMMKGIFPSLSLSSGLDSSAISRDIEEVKKYNEDPLVHDKVSAKMGIEMIETGQWAIDNAAKLSVPTLLYHGTADRLTSHHGSELFAQKAGKNLTFISLEGLYHETHNEPEKAEVFKKIILWLDNLV